MIFRLKFLEETFGERSINRLYAGGTQEQLSGLVHLDARHYSPAKTKFVQPDPYSLTELSLPEEARHTLVKATGLTLEGLLADPSQQLSNSYAGNNPLRWRDILGLVPLETITDAADDLIDEVNDFFDDDDDDKEEDDYDIPNIDYDAPNTSSGGEFDVEFNSKGVGFSYAKGDLKISVTTINGTITASLSCSF